MRAYIPQTLPFFDAVNRQHARICPNVFLHKFQASYNSDTDEHTFYVPHFQIRREAALGGGAVNLFRLHSLTHGLIYEAPVSNFSVEPLDAGGVNEAIVHQASTYTYVFNGGELIDDTLYWEVGDGWTGRYSETFTYVVVPGNPDTHHRGCDIKIKWKTPCLLEGAYFNDPEGFEILLDGEPGKPKYIYEEDGDTDRLGTFRPAWKRIEKEYEVELKAPEHIADALAYTAMFSEVTVLYADGTGYGNVRDIRTEAEWDADGCLATVRWRFRADFVFKTACC